MRLLLCYLGLVIGCSTVRGQDSNTVMQTVFTGSPSIEMRLRSRGDEPTRSALHLRISQLTSSTAAALQEIKWKSMQLLPAQTILEEATVSLPDVTTPTHFLIQAIDAKRDVIGSTQVLAFPRNYLLAIEKLSGKGGVGLYDPSELFSSLAREVGLAHTHLEEDVPFKGRLGLVISGENDTAANRVVESLGQRNIPCVWMQQSAAPEFTQLQLAIPLNSYPSVLRLRFTQTNFLQTAQGQSALIEMSKYVLKQSNHENLHP